MHWLFQVEPKTLFPALTVALKTNCREIKEWLEKTLCDTESYTQMPALLCTKDIFDMTNYSVSVAVAHSNCAGGGLCIEWVRSAFGC